MEDKWEKSKIKTHYRGRESNIFAEYKSFAIRLLKTYTRWAWLNQLTGHMVFTDIPTLGEQQVNREPDGPTTCVDNGMVQQVCYEDSQPRRNLEL